MEETQPQYPRWRVFYVVLLSFIFIVGEATWPLLQPTRYGFPSLMQIIHREVPGLLRTPIVSAKLLVTNEMVLTMQPNNSRSYINLDTVGSNLAVHNQQDNSIELFDADMRRFDTLMVGSSFLDFGMMLDEYVVVEVAAENGDQNYHVYKHDGGDDLFEWGSLSLLTTSIGPENPIAFATSDQFIYFNDFFEGVVLFSEQGKRIDAIDYRDIALAQEAVAVDQDANIYIPFANQRIYVLDGNQDAKRIDIAVNGDLIDVRDDDGWIIVGDRKTSEKGFDILVIDRDHVPVMQFIFEDYGYLRDIAFLGDQLIVLTDWHLLTIAVPE